MSITRFAVAIDGDETVAADLAAAHRFQIFDAYSGFPAVQSTRVELAPSMALNTFTGEGVHPLDAVDVTIARSCSDAVIRRLARRSIVVVVSAESDPAAAVEQFLVGHGGSRPTSH